MPVTNVPDGTVLTSAIIHANYRDQVISTVTSGTRPSGTEGQMIYETDTDRFYVYSGSGWVEWGGIGAWVSYTPTLTQSGAVTKTVTYAKYTKIGRTVTVQGSLAITSTGTAGNAVLVGLPITAATTNLDVGTGHINDNSASLQYSAVTNLASTTTLQFFDTIQGFSQPMGGATAAFSAALASPDAVYFNATYEAAA